MGIIFFGNEKLATGVSTTAPILKSLIAAGYKVSAIVVNQDNIKSRSKQEPVVEKVAHKHGIPIYFDKNLESLRPKIQQYKAGVGILVAYGKLIPSEILDIFPRGIINLHPSLLPLHRGPTPIESVILNGESKTGVSIIQLSDKMDAGPIFVQESFDLKGSETKQQLADKALATGASMINDLLPSVLSGKARATPQNDIRATYDTQIQKAAGTINWSEDAKKIERQVRAYAGWPKSKTVIKGLEIIIIEANEVDDSGEPGQFKVTNDSLLVFAGKGALNIKRLQPAGKKEMDISEFLRGYKDKLN